MCTRLPRALITRTSTDAAVTTARVPNTCGIRTTLWSLHSLVMSLAPHMS